MLNIRVFIFGACFRFTFLLTPVWWDEGSSENLTSWIWFQGMILGFVDFSLKMRDKTRCVQVYGLTLSQYMQDVRLNIENINTNGNTNWSLVSKPKPQCPR